MPESSWKPLVEGGSAVCLAVPGKVVRLLAQDGTRTVEVDFGGGVLGMCPGVADGAPAVLPRDASGTYPYLYSGPDEPEPVVIGGRP